MSCSGSLGCACRAALTYPSHRLPAPVQGWWGTWTMSKRGGECKKCSLGQHTPCCLAMSPQVPTLPSGVPMCQSLLSQHHTALWAWRMAEPSLSWLIFNLILFPDLTLSRAALWYTASAAWSCQKDDKNQRLPLGKEMLTECSWKRIT